MTKYQRLRGLNNRNLCFHSSGSWMFMTKVPSGVVSLGGSHLGLQVVAFLLKVHRVFPLCCCGAGERRRDTERDRDYSIFLSL